jgi:hypothetical protein
MRFTAGRNQRSLTEKQIAYCKEVWAALCADQPIALETSEAVQYAFNTKEKPRPKKAYLRRGESGMRPTTTLSSV